MLLNGVSGFKSYKMRERVNLLKQCINTAKKLQISCTIKVATWFVCWNHNWPLQQYACLNGQFTQKGNSIIYSNRMSKLLFSYMKLNGDHGHSLVSIHCHCMKNQDWGWYLVIDDGFWIIKDKVPIIAVYETDQGNKGSDQPGVQGSQFWQGDVMIPVRLRKHHLSRDFCSFWPTTVLQNKESRWKVKIAN